MSHYYAAVSIGTAWAVIRYTDTGKTTSQARKLGVWERDKHIILTGLSQDSAIARAAALNGSHAIAKKQTVRPRPRVGIRAG